MATVRLDTTTEATLKRLAAQRGQTKSDVIRDAIVRLASDEVEQPSALDRLRAYAGIADSGGRQLSTDTGRKLRDLLEERRRARSSG